MGFLGFGVNKRREYDKLVVTQLNDLFGITPAKAGGLKLAQCLDDFYKNGAYIAILSIAFGYAEGTRKINSKESISILQKMIAYATKCKSSGLIDPAAADRMLNHLKAKSVEFAALS
ncbi:MAG: hypothetical protein PHR66_07880 [Desulfuromonadaceae bacterium]|nr:hypothetical protein [Desulfuromonadaceae bacterium]